MRISSWRIASASRSTSSRSLVASPPTIRIARPGPGNGWRQTSRSGRPSSAPTARTSSLNSDRSGSTSSNSQVVGQAADVVVGLDRRRARRRRRTRSRRSRACPGRGSATSVELRRLLLEDADELRADQLALAPRDRSTPAQRSRKRSSASTATSGTLKWSRKARDHLLALVLAHQAVVDEHARQLVADRAVDEQRGDRGVDAAREPADHAARRRPARGSARPARRSIDAGDQRALAAADVARGSASGSAGRTGCGRPRGGTGCRRRRARVARTRRPASRSRRRAPRSPGGGSKTVSRCDIQQVCSRGHPRQQRSGLATRAARSGRTRPTSAPARRARRACARAAACRSRCRAPGRRAPAAQGRARGAPVRVHRRRAAREDQARAACAPRDLLAAPTWWGSSSAEHAALAHAAGDQLRVLAAVVEHHDLLNAPARLAASSVARVPSALRPASAMLAGERPGRYLTRSDRHRVSH